MSRLKDRIAVVSGAAAGLGRAAAVRLAAEGAKIEILDVKNASEVCEEIRASGGVAYSSICDVTDEAQIAEAVGGVGRRHGRVDILVNNAGILSGRTPWHQLTYDEINRFVQINYVGYFLVSKAVYPLLKKSQCGRVINVASRTYFLANPGQMAYVAAKGAVMGMTRVMAHTSMRFGSDSRVSCVMTVCFNAEVISSSGASPLTTTPSSMVPISSLASARAVVSALTVMPSCVKGRNP